MPNKIKPKRSYTANAVPTTSDLDANELAINWADGKAYTKNAAGNIVSLTLGGSGGGGVEDAGLRALFLPAAPTGLTAEAGVASATLYWSAPTGVIAQAPITDYREQYSTDGGTTWTTFTGGAASTATTTTVTGLANGTAVRFRVAAVNAVGVGAYSTASAAVTPEAIVTDPLFSSVSLLLHADGTGSTFVDSSGTSKTVTAVGDATQTTAQSKFGGSSANFYGSADYLTVANSSGFTFAGDFTIEFFARFTGKPSNYIAFFAGSSGATQMFLTTHQSGDNLRWGLSATAEYASGNFEWQLYTWYYIAVRRQSGAITLWVNGTNITTGSPTNSRTYSGGFNLFGGIQSVSDFIGQADEFRITQGAARTITVPTKAFPNS